jgi:hypothetical protein
MLGEKILPATPTPLKVPPVGEPVSTIGASSIHAEFCIENVTVGCGKIVTITESVAIHPAALVTST